MDLINLSKENRLLVCCSKSCMTENDEKFVRDLIVNDNLNWSVLLYDALNHRIINMFYEQLKRLKLLEYIEEEVVKTMRIQSTFYTERNKAYIKEALTLSEALYQKNLKVAIIKGIYLSKNCYSSIGLRTFNDIDFLMNRTDAEETLKVLKENDYIQADYDRNTFEVLPASRKQIMIHELSTHELQECLKETSNEFVRLYQVDVNHDILWGGKCPYKVPTLELLERGAYYIEGTDHYFLLSLEDNLIQLACHLYKEAVLMNWISDLRDLRLYKFLDFEVLICEKGADIDWVKLLELVKKYDLMKVIYYSFWHVNTLYPQLIPSFVLDELNPGDSAYLNAYAIETENPKMWEKPFLERLFNHHRSEEIDLEASKHAEKFWKERGK